MSCARGFTLLQFQAEAARQIADRFELLNGDPDDRPMFTKYRAVPFFQGLSALTGAGKTVILAQAIADMAVGMPLRPIVLWVTRLRVVVEQTFQRLIPGGIYASLMAGWNGAMLSDLKREAVGDPSSPLLVAATVASFNRDSPEESSLLVHQVRADEGEDSLWGTLQIRKITTGKAAGRRRPLFVVYDEAHNLTEAQTQVLMSLQPDALLAASGTLALREGLSEVLSRLRSAGWNGDRTPDVPGEPKKSLITQIPNPIVVAEGLVKQEVVLGGYDSSMEALLDDLLADMKVAEDACKASGLTWLPRAIHVCQTNINLDDGLMDNHRVAFEHRRAPPILIWRQLVARGIDPATIAVYCDLKVDKANPMPPAFRLFAGADKDFAAFTAGGFRHVIFNQALQEGWDDPQVCFGYIDKTMGSRTAVEQVIGRVLRQPCATHYSDPALNTGTFFIRLEDRQGFRPILEEVQRSLGTQPGDVAITVRPNSKTKPKTRLLPKQTLTAPRIFVVSDEAEKDMDAIVTALPDHTGGGPNTEGVGTRSTTVLEVGKDAAAQVKESEIDHSSSVTARWLIAREMRTLYPESLTLLDPEDAHADKLDALVDRTSNAAKQFREAGKQLVLAYLEGSHLQVESTNVYKVGPVDVDPAKAIAFSNAAHSSYELNPLELPVARALDALGFPWCRNPSQIGYRIPLLDTGPTRNFFPDFLVWKDSHTFCIDPKGPQLLRNEAGRKTMNISSLKGDTRIFSRLISEGKFSNDFKKEQDEGYTVWRWDAPSSNIRKRHFQTVDAAVAYALKA